VALAFLFRRPISPVQPVSRFWGVVEEPDRFGPPAAPVTTDPVTTDPATTDPATPADPPDRPAPPSGGEPAAAVGPRVDLAKPGEPPGDTPGPDS
jgi:hypothetical protein